MVTGSRQRGWAKHAAVLPPRPASCPSLIRRVLVVDDDSNSADAVATLLRCLGNETRSVYCGEDALAEARVFLPDVVILDLDMPALNGPETAQCLMEDGLSCGARIIAMTGRDDPSARNLCAGLGFHGFLRKPVNQEELIRAMQCPPIPNVTDHDSSGGR